MRRHTVALFGFHAALALTGTAAVVSHGLGSASTPVHPRAAAVVHAVHAPMRNARPHSHVVASVVVTADQAVGAPVPSGAAHHHKAAPQPHQRAAVSATILSAARPVAIASPPVLTPRQRLERAVARIPGGPDPTISWVLEAQEGHWGTADWYRNVIWISPAVPSGHLYDVVVHEWSHLKSVKSYGGDVGAAMTAMNGYFGGTGLEGAERAADCMARLDGATWTHYTGCDDSRWRAGAARLLRGQQL